MACLNFRDDRKFHMQLEAGFLAQPRVRQRAGHRLTLATIKRAHRPGKLADGNGLWLVVDAPNRRYWQYRYQWQGRTKSLSFGSADRVGLAEARAEHAKARLMVERGIDPQARRQAAIAVLQPPPAPPVAETFAFAAAEYLAAHEAGWKHPKHRQQWQNTLAATHPLIGDVPVRLIDTSDVLKVLTPIWQVKPETASRLRGRIAAVIDYATVRGWRERGPNPAAWHGHLEHALASKGKLRPSEPHPALPWREAPAFLGQLRDEAGMGALALEFLILTAARSGEVRGARWEEIDLTTGIWAVPAERMKADREHRVPLSRPALLILLKLAEVRDGSGLIFFGRVRGKPLSDMTLTALVRRMGYADLTVHGFRSTFRDWVADGGDPADAAERALAHVIGNKVRGAYERTDLLDVRRKLMADWAAYLDRAPAEVVALRVGTTS
jgi:integrase